MKGPVEPHDASPRRRRWHWSLDLAVGLLVFFALQTWLTRDVVRGSLPPLAAPLVSSTAASAADWRDALGGEAHLLYVWASWCGVCKAMEGTVEVVARDAPLLTVAMQSGAPSAVQAALAGRGLRWPTLVDDNGELSRALGISAVPTLIFVDRSGRVSSVTRGYTTELGIRARLWWARRAG